ncbi:MAG: transcription-repair coupling factor, partial [Acidimicrobiia bacterium]
MTDLDRTAHSTTSTTAPPLAALAAALRDEPVFSKILGRRTVAVAVPEAARAVVLAGLAHLSERRPIVVVVPNGSVAERLAQDLAQLVDPSDVELFPAWETLPFERVSPAIETMGRRLQVLWRLQDKDRAPKIVVTAARALAQRLGPHVEETEPIVIRPGDQIDPTDLVSRLVAMGYRREDLAEHRGEVAIRGSIVDVFGSTADQPVRIDLWGDEVERLSEFSVTDQRSTDSIDETVLFPARELLATDEVRARAESLMTSEPWGREHWDKLSNGLTFDGMESWLPWLTPTERTLLDVLDDRAQLIFVEPKRMRDRAAEILAEEEDLATTLAGTWGAGDRVFPKLHLPFDALLDGKDLPAWSMVNAPESPDTPAVAATPWAPVVGDGEALVRRMQGLLS